VNEKFSDEAKAGETTGAVQSLMRRKPAKRQAPFNLDEAKADEATGAVHPLLTRKARPERSLPRRSFAALWSSAAAMCTAARKKNKTIAL
jgi:hypothetical protein